MPKANDNVICFTLYLVFNYGILLNNKFVTPAMYVNKFNGAIII